MGVCALFCYNEHLANRSPLIFFAHPLCFSRHMFNIYDYYIQMQGSPELLEVKMGTDGYSDGSDDNNRDIDNDNSVEVSERVLIVASSLSQY